MTDNIGFKRSKQRANIHRFLSGVSFMATWHRRLKGLIFLSRLGLGLGMGKKDGWRSPFKISKEFPFIMHGMAGHGTTQRKSFA
jgi:hypothetical protein